MITSDTLRQIADEMDQRWLDHMIIHSIRLHADHGEVRVRLFSPGGDEPMNIRVTV
jgi:hypothetical protein